DNGKAFPMMDVDNVNHKALFVTNDGSNIATDKIYKYDLNASSWSEVTTNGLPQNVVMNCLKNIDDNEWLLATNVGLYRSKDGGVNWSIAHSSDYWQNGIIVNSIVKINDKAFLGTMANGVWEVDLSTGVANPLSEKDFLVFPNPAIDKLTIAIPEWNAKSAEITIYNIEGKKVFNTLLTTNPTTVSLNHLTAGTYLVELKSNGTIFHKTVVKK
ncbi:MAG TPA: T9SS type A sorting domain-containing protein, partial [Paludibacteraceae bacterium]|nr:T9SS type A sorting domain-containing protein [Paludibacteraceae bacterium]